MNNYLYLLFPVGLLLAFFFLISALEFWTNTRDERIDVLNAYIEKQRVRREKRAQGIDPISDSDEDNPFMFTVPQNNNDEEEEEEIEPDEVLDGDDRLIEEEDENISDCNQEINEFERFVKNSAQDDYHEDEPQPSTSRDFKPIINPIKNKIKNKGVVKIIKNTRRKNNSKSSLKKKSTDLQTETSNDDDILDNENIYENFPPESEIEDGEFITDEIQINQRAIKKEFIVTDKKLQKKEKREAKMKEISEQLRKMSGITNDEESEEELII